VDRIATKYPVFLSVPSTWYLVSARVSVLKSQILASMKKNSPEMPIGFLGGNSQLSTVHCLVSTMLITTNVFRQWFCSAFFVFLPHCSFLSFTMSDTQMRLVGPGAMLRHLLFQVSLMLSLARSGLIMWMQTGWKCLFIVLL
jgi:hypothetical protein